MKRKSEEEEDTEVAEWSSWSHGSRWKRGRLIGKGEFGSVFLATLKKPKSKFSCFPSTMAVKSAEVSVSGSLQKEKQVLDNVQGCPYVIKCFGEEITDSDKGEMVYNLLLEFASGGTLADQIKKSAGRGLPEIDVKRYTRAILRGLIHIHDRSYVHCDLKPENILLVSNPNQCGCGCFVAKIGDFGLEQRKPEDILLVSNPNDCGCDKFVAKIGDFGLAKRKTKNKQKIDPYLRGTAMYLAPETIAYNVQEPPSDVWALGCVVLEMLTCQPPWQKNPNLNTEDLLNLISDDKELPIIPSTISKEGREFLKGCFVRNAMFRLTAEMLLYHPFLTGLDDDGYNTNVDELTAFSLIDDDDDDDDEEEVDEDDYIDDADDDELYYSSFSDDWDSVDEDDICSSSEELKDIELPINGNLAEEMKLEGPKVEVTVPPSCITGCNGENALGPLNLASTIRTGV